MQIDIGVSRKATPPNKIGKKEIKVFGIKFYLSAPSMRPNQMLN